LKRVEVAFTLGPNGTGGWNSVSFLRFRGFCQISQ
jgi:hypothetical protein